jgi:protein SCO1/2
MTRSSLSFVAALLVALLMVCSVATAQPFALPAPPKAGLDQRIGAQVPLSVEVTDDMGLHRRLADYVDGTRPVLLVPGYYRCPQLCGLVMHSLLDALQAGGVPRGDWRIVGVGIDPHETVADARARRELDVAYADALLGANPPERAIDLHLLLLPPAELAQVTAAIGDRFEPVRDATSGSASIAHPATVVLLTPRGEIARYFNGVGIDPDDMRVALADAAGDRLGSVSARLALLCAHFDPHVGRLNDAVMSGLRAGCTLLAIALAGWCWRRRGTREGGPR